MSLTKTVARFIIGAVLAGVLALLGLIALEIALFIFTLISQSHGISAQDKALMDHVGHSVMGMKRSDA